MKKRLLIVLVLTVVMTVSLVQYQSRVEAKDSGIEENKLTLMSGSSRGYWYRLSAIHAELLTNGIKDVIVTPVEGTSNDNIRVVGQGKDAQIGYTWGSSAVDAINGVRYFEKQKYPDIRQLFQFQDSYFYLVTRAKSGIKSLKDLVGKRVQTGRRRSAQDLYFDIIMKEAGITAQDMKNAGHKRMYETYSSAANNMKDGHIDAFVLVGPLKHSVLMELETYFELRLIPIPKKVADGFLKQVSGFNGAVAKAGTYKWIKEDVPVLKYFCIAIANAKLSEERVYEIMKITYNNIDALQKVSSQAFGHCFNLEHALDGIDAEYLHPGAAKYFKEAGVLR